MRRVCRRRTMTAGPRAAVIIAVALAMASSVPTVGSAAARGSGIGVVDFYAGPLRPLEGIVPEARAADDLAALVARAAGTQIIVIPRATVRQAESAIRWQGSDVLRFARLQELARTL